MPLTDVYKKRKAEDVVVLGADLIKKYNGEESIKTYAFNILKQVEAPRTSPNYGSQWSVVFDCKNTLVYFKTLNNNEIRTIDLKNFDFNCNQDFKALSITQSEPQGIYSQFKPFTPDENLKMFKEGIKVFLHKNKLPFYIVKLIERVANIPYSYKCQ